MKFSIPSISNILKTGLKTFYRFPSALLIAFLGTLTAMWMVGLSDSRIEELEWLARVLLISGLGISLSVGIDTLSENKNWDLVRRYLGRLAVLIVLISYYFFSETRFNESPTEFGYQFFLFALASHLFVAFSPFFSKGNVDEFWEYNKTLFLRICISALYSAVLFIGLSVALLSIDNLLGINIKDIRYPQLFMFLVGIFNTCFFLAGVPKLEKETEIKAVYPKALKIFVQFVLIPLVTVYIGILYLYTGKILVQWELPNGWVSYLVLSFSIVGIFSLLLLYPIRNKEENKWVNIYSKGYYWALVPLIGLLLFSIYVRISEYGVTINRYFVATLGVWLTGIVIYFIFSKLKSIKVIPLSMCVVALAISFGPIGAFSVSERSQLGRFEEVLERNEMLDENNRIIPKSGGKEIPFEERKELSSLVDYIVENHSYHSLEKLFTTSLKDEIVTIELDRNWYESKSETVFRFMNLDYVNSWENEATENQYFSFSGESTWGDDISGFDAYLSNINLGPNIGTLVLLNSGVNAWKISLNDDLKIYKIEEVYSQKSLKFDLEPILKELKEASIGFEDNYSIPRSRLKFDYENEELKVRFYVNSISGNYYNQAILSSIESDIFIKIKQ